MPVERCLQTKNKKIKPIGFDIPHLKDVDFSEAQTFVNTFGEDSVFFYRLEHRTRHGELIMYECGIAKMVQDEVFRIRATSQGLSNPIYTDRLMTFDLTENEYLVIYSIVPDSYIEAMCIPNSVLVVGDSIQVVQLPEYSILGRKDGNIEAIKFEEIYEYTKRNE